MDIKPVVNDGVPEYYFKQLMILCIALIAGQVFFGGVCAFLANTGGNGLQGMDTLLLCIGGGLVLIGLSGGMLIFPKQIESLRSATDLKEKLNRYRAATLVRFALLEIPSFFSMVCVILTHQLYYFGGSALMILISLSLLPTRQRISNDLEI